MFFRHLEYMIGLYISLDSIRIFELKKRFQYLLALVSERQGQRKDRKGATDEIAPL